MENNSNDTCYSSNSAHTGRKQVKQIVDEPLSNYPQLLRWLKRNIKLLKPVNNTNYNPYHPAS